MPKHSTARLTPPAPALTASSMRPVDGGAGACARRLDGMAHNSLDSPQRAAWRRSRSGRRNPSMLVSRAMACHFFDRGVVEIDDLGPRLGVDSATACRRPWRPRARTSPVGADGHDQGLLVLGQLVEDLLGHQQRLEHEPVRAAAARGQRLETSSSRNEIRLVDDVMPRPSRRSASPRRSRWMAASAPRRRHP